MTPSPRNGLATLATIAAIAAILTGCGSDEPARKATSKEDGAPGISEKQTQSAGIAKREAVELYDWITACLGTKPAAQCSQEQLLAAEPSWRESFAAAGTAGGAFVTVNSKDDYSAWVMTGATFDHPTIGDTPIIFKVLRSAGKDLHNCEPRIAELCVDPPKGEEFRVGVWEP